MGGANCPFGGAMVQVLPVHSSLVQAELVGVAWCCGLCGAQGPVKPSEAEALGSLGAPPDQAEREDLYHEFTRAKAENERLREVMNSATCQLVEGVEFEPAIQVASRVAGQLSKALAAGSKETPTP